MAWMDRNRERGLPTVEQLEGEMDRIQYGKSYKNALRGTVYALIIVAGLSMLVSTLLLSVLRIYGDNMDPTLSSGNIVVALKTSRCSQGDVVALYYNNKILIRRVIALSGDLVEVSGSGEVLIDGTLLEEPYVAEPDLGQCNIQMPYEVPQDQLFVMGDQRQTAVDSRVTAIGSIPQEQVIGKVVLRIWPLDQVGVIK